MKLETSSMYYIALLCPQEVDDYVDNIKKKLLDRYGCRNALKSPAHITIIPPFWTAQKNESRLKEVLGSFSFEPHDIIVLLDGFSHFSHRTLFIQVREQPLLGLLRQQLQEHILIRLPGLFKTDERKFHPHVTLATRDLRPADLDMELDQLQAKGFTAEYHAESFTLLRLEEGKWQTIQSNFFAP